MMTKATPALLGALGFGVAVLAILYLIEPAPAPVGLVGLIALTVAACRAPVVILSLVAACLPLYHRPLGIGESIVAPSELLLLASLGGTLIILSLDLLRRRVNFRDVLGARPLSRYRWVAALGVLAVAGLLILLASVDDAGERAAGLREWRWTLAEPLLFVGLLLAHARDRRSRAMLIGGYAVGAAAVAGWGLVDGLTGQGVTAGGVLRVDGPFPHPNAYALYLLRPVVGGAALLLILGRRGRFAWALLGVLAAALLASFARSAMLGLFVGGLLLLPWLSRRVRVASSVAAVATVALLVVVAGDRLVGTSGLDSLTLRGDIWRSSLEMIRDRPFLGYGPDQFLYVYVPRYIEPAAWAERFTSHGHNFLIDAWIRIGIIGAAFALLASVVIAGRAARRAEPDPVAMAATIALAAALAQGMVDNGYFVHDLAMSAWLLAWLVFERPRDSPTERSPSA